MSLAEANAIETDEAIRSRMIEIGRKARAASARLAHATTEEKNTAIAAMSAALRRSGKELLAANAEDLARARDNNLTPAMVDRLKLDEKRIEGIAQALDDIGALPDPIGSKIEHWTRPNGLKISKVRVPLGVIGIIYESRPNVTADAGALCLKSGNAVILRGGSEAIGSSRAIHACLKEGLRKAGLPEDSIQLVPTTDRRAVGVMLGEMTAFIDVIVPRGGKSLIARVQREARVPVIGHLEGLCHVYVDKSADLEMAKRIVVNAKMRRTGICGAAETLLVDKACAPDTSQAARRSPDRCGLRRARRYRHPGRRQPRHTCDRRGLAHRISRGNHLGTDCRWRQRRDRAHRNVWLASHRSHHCG